MIRSLLVYQGFVDSTGISESGSFFILNLGKTGPECCKWEVLLKGFMLFNNVSMCLPFLRKKIMVRIEGSISPCFRISCLRCQICFPDGNLRLSMWKKIWSFGAFAVNSTITSFGFVWTLSRTLGVIPSKESFSKRAKDTTASFNWP